MRRADDQCARTLMKSHEFNWLNQIKSLRLALLCLTFQQIAHEFSCQVDLQLSSQTMTASFSVCEREISHNRSTDWSGNLKKQQLKVRHHRLCEAKWVDHELLHSCTVSFWQVTKVDASHTRTSQHSGKCRRRPHRFQWATALFDRLRQQIN